MKRYLVAGILVLVVGVLIARAPEPVPHPIDSAPADLTVASLNMAKEEHCDTVMRDLRHAPRLLQADVLLLQEVVERKGRPSLAHQVASHFGYAVAYSAEMPGVEDRGLAILSRYPISETSVRPLRQYDLRFHSRNRFSIGTTVHAPSGAIRVWNVHLDTRLNAGQRVEQISPLLKATASGGAASLIGGDFNTNDYYWVGNVLPFPAGKSHSAVLRQEMRRFGFESPFADEVITHSVARRHLDWIYTSGLKPVHSSVEPIPFSDHHAIWVSLQAGTGGH